LRHRAYRRRICQQLTWLHAILLIFRIMFFILPFVFLNIIQHQRILYLKRLKSAFFLYFRSVLTTITNILVWELKIPSIYWVNQFTTFIYRNCFLHLLSRYIAEIDCFHHFLIFSYLWMLLISAKLEPNKNGNEVYYLTFEKFLLTYEIR
jgi:hypothetical protein